jgi:sugar phosphate isomerase/epimerase
LEAIMRIAAFQTVSIDFPAPLVQHPGHELPLAPVAPADTRHPPPSTLFAPLNLKQRYPFRLGTTSYILPDHILPNVRFLAPLVDDIELVLFESAEHSNMPGPADIETLRQLALAHDLSYTVHLPLDIELGHHDRTRRLHSVEQCRRVVELTRPLAPFAWILHLSHPAGPDPIPDHDRARWLGALAEATAALADVFPDPFRCCVETLSYPFGWVEDIVNGRGFSVCFDVGHLLLRGTPLAEAWQRLGDRTRVMHLHGVRGRTDHTDISALAPDVLSLLWSALRRTEHGTRAVTLEVFNRHDFERSVETLAAAWPCQL